MSKTVPIVFISICLPVFIFSSIFDTRLLIFKYYNYFYFQSCPHLKEFLFVYQCNTFSLGPIVSVVLFILLVLIAQKVFCFSFTKFPFTILCFKDRRRSISIILRQLVILTLFWGSIRVGVYSVDFYHF